jgi:hypothetical protein
MNQQNLKADLNLIQRLLNCAPGEEWTLLQQHEELVSPELVQVMQQVAEQLATEGNAQAAKFLRHWAAQLEHVLAASAHPPSSEDRSQAYLKLIQALLDCPKGSEADILAGNRELIDLGLAKMIQQVINQLTAQGDRHTASFLRHLAAEIGQRWLPAQALKPQLAREEPETLFPAGDRPIAPPPLPIDLADLQPAPLPAPAGEVMNQQISDRLSSIAESLTKLEQTLASRLLPADPLWYMNVLERAQAANWILTSEEVEQLIGVKPHCENGKNSYQRGCWQFVKAGKMGSQTAWRVMKEEETGAGEKSN